MFIQLKKVFMKDELLSVKVKIMHDSIIDTVSVNCLTDNIYIPYLFKENENYHIIVSIVYHGIQIVKFQHTFSYNQNYQYIDDKIHLSFGLNCKNLSQKEQATSLKETFFVNPLAMYREEGNCTSVYVNGNIFLLRGDLRKVFKAIERKEVFTNLSLDDEIIIKKINLLIEKGCVLCYE